MRKGLIKISYDELRKLIGLSDENIVYGVVQTDKAQRSDTILVKVLGPDTSSVSNILYLGDDGWEIPITPLKDIIKDTD